MKIALLNTHLRYVIISSGKIHAGRTESTYTFCGRSIPPHAWQSSSRELDTDMLCGRCYRTLRTYSDSSVKAR